MEYIIDLENASINSLLSERTLAHWQDIPEFSPLIEPIIHLDDIPAPPAASYILKLVQLTCESDEEQSNRLFLLLESYCAVVDSEVFANILAYFILEGSEPYPSLTNQPTTGWLAWALDYKPELARKGEMVKRLWKLAQWRGEDVVKLSIEKMVTMLIKKQEVRRDAANQDKQTQTKGVTDQDTTKNYGRSYHSILYLLQCGPLSGQAPMLWHEESILNTLIRLRDGNDPRALENQQLILANLLDRIFLWMESKDYCECIEQLKERDAILRFLDGRWSGININEESNRPKHAGLSLMDINKERNPIHYLSLETPGSFGFPENKSGTREQGRSEVEKEYEISDLVSQCFEGHDQETIEQLLRSFVTHIGIRIDTIMVSAASAVKHAAQQRRIMTSAMNQGLERVLPNKPKIALIYETIPWQAASICLPLIQAMLRCAISHWSNCKNTTPQAYPKELEEAIWVAQLAENILNIVFIFNYFL
ncbi:hypothetical protein BGZ76_005534 [Entomortierella beljakovae]|nr:hypothetical protein BGZ76_005534 [Entomortierella beljakovae]